MICSACEEYAASSSSDPKNPLCGNCIMLSPADLKKVISAREAKAQIKAGMEPGKMISDLKQQVEQLTADLEAKDRKHAADIEALKAMQDEPRRGPGRPPLNRDG